MRVAISGFNIKNASFGGIRIYNTRTSGYVIARNNICESNGVGIYNYYSKDNKIYNNVLYNNAMAGFHSDGGASITGLELRNNIAVNNGFFGGLSVSSGITATSDYNNVWNNSGGNYSQITPGTHDISVDPLFVEVSSSDFHISSSSPVINSGATFSEVPTDIVGVARPQGVAYDIGAYEYYDVSVSLTALSPDPTADTTPTFTGTSSTPHGSISSVSYSVDEGAWTSTGVTGTTSYSITLPSALAEGVHTIKVRATDSNGYTTDSTLFGTGSFTVDTSGPVGSISVNAGAIVTADRDVILTLSATDALSSVTHVMFSESATFVVASWEAYATSKAFTLSSSNGTKTVYAKYKDAAGNESEKYSATITLDTVKPAIKITDIGLIDNVPDKTPLYYYFTSQTPHIKGTTEANSTVHFTYEGTDTTVTAGADGKYEIDITELPRQYVELEYYAVDPASNQGSTRLLKLMIGVENFPAELLPQEEATETPSGEVSPTPTTNGEPPTETIKVFGIQVADQDGTILAETAVYIDGQKYITDKNGKIYIEKKPTEEMTVEVEVNGKRIKGSVMGEKIVAEASIQAITKGGTITWFKVLLWVLVLGGAGYGAVKVARSIGKN